MSRDPIQTIRATIGFAALAALPACGGADRPQAPSRARSETAATTSAADTTSSGSGGCSLNSPSGRVRHVIYVQFDNVHFTRTNPNVPSDLERLEGATFGGQDLDVVAALRLVDRAGDLLARVRRLSP